MKQSTKAPPVGSVEKRWGPWEMDESFARGEIRVQIVGRTDGNRARTRELTCTGRAGEADAKKGGP